MITSGEITTGSECILLVDGDAQIRKMISRELANCGYTVCTAGSGSAALEILESGGMPTIDLLLTDVSMPEMNGRNLTERVAKMNPGIEVLYMSGYPDDALLRLGVLEGRVNFISKPFCINDLIRTIREVLDGGMRRP